MLKFNEQKKRESINGALGLRAEINEIVDKLCQQGYSNLCWLGIGGTWASALQAVVHMKEYTTIETFSENAAEYLSTGNQRVNQDTVVIISSVTGSTQEMVDALKVIKEKGSTIIGFVDVENSPLSPYIDYEINYLLNEQLKFYMVADRFMYNHNEFDCYEKLYAELDENLAEALIAVEKKADTFGEDFAQKHNNDSIHYFVGAGNQWGATYSYAMCYWEEQHWIRSKSIHSAEFFHGTLEVIDRDTAVTVYIGEDAQRCLGQRVADFIPKICSRYTLIDTADYELVGISQEFRGMLSHHVMHAINDRIDAHLEKINCHPMEIRRYYKRLEY